MMARFRPSTDGVGSHVILPMLLAVHLMISSAAFVLPAASPAAAGAGSSCLSFEGSGARASIERSYTSPALMAQPRSHSKTSPSSWGRTMRSGVKTSKRSLTAMEATVRQVTAEELEVEMTEWDSPLILDVFAVWCGPCLQLKPEIEKVAQALDGKCRVLKMDSDDEEAMASTLNVYGLPTILYMKDGAIAHRTEGSMPADEILQLADIHLFGAPPPEDPMDGLFIDTDDSSSSTCGPSRDAGGANADTGNSSSFCQPATDTPPAACQP